MNFLENLKKYGWIIILLLITYIGIKLINNYNAIINIFSYTYSIISPFAYALIIAYILNPLVKLFNNRLKLNKGISILLTYAILIAAISISFVFIVPSLLNSITQLVADIPLFIDSITKLLNKIPHETYSKIDFTSLANTVQHNIMSFLSYILTSTISTTIYIGKWLLGLLISIYVIIYKEEVILLFKKITYLLFGNKFGKNLVDFTRTLNDRFIAYIVIKGATSLLIGFLSFIGLSIIGSPYSLLIAIFVAIFNMIPYFGPFLGIALGFFINLFLLPSKAIIVMVYLFILQQFDAWVLDPNTVGPKVGLNPLVSLLSVTIGGALYGPIGMLLSTPVAATLTIYISKYLNTNVKLT
ncbi:MAG: AI-2E family transporter [Clostridium sp.]